MHSVLGFAAISASLLCTLVKGAPVIQPNGSSTISSSTSQKATSTPSGSSILSSSTSIPFVNDGFPTPSNEQLLKIEGLAHGTLPNGPPPPPGSISSEGINNLAFIQFNENFEVAFFSSLLHNVTSNVPGFVISDSNEKDSVVQALTAVLAQEELHAINAGQALQSQKMQPILPCKYQFPTTTFDDAIALAATFTDVVLGTLQDVIESFADNNDNALTRGVASVLGQEAEQDGFYRILQKKNKIPSALPFLTTSTRDFAFSALQAFHVPGSCPNSNLIKLDIFGVLKLDTKTVEPKDQNLEFSFDIKTLQQSSLTHTSAGSAHYEQYFKGNSSSVDYSKFDYSQLSLVYINQQNTPIVEKLQNVKIQGSVVTFDALFPFQENLLNGLTIGAVTFNAGPFANAQAVADATLFAPALIEIN